MEIFGLNFSFSFYKLVYLFLIKRLMPLRWSSYSYITLLPTLSYGSHNRKTGRPGRKGNNRR